MVFEGKAVFGALLGGRYVRQEYDSPMGGMPFEGIGYTGFNKATGKFEAVWMDNTGTGIMFLAGEESEPGKVWCYAGRFCGPGGQAVRCREEMTSTNADEMRMVMYLDYGQGESKCMEQVYTRAE